MLCPGSAVLSQGAVRTTSDYAFEGTVIHACAATVLTGGAWPALGERVFGTGDDEFKSVTWNADMQECGQEYVDYVRSLDGDNLWVEQRVSFAEPLGIPADADDGFGTADAIVAKGTELIVGDLKTGRGVDVDATDNPQLKCYALGALELLNGLAGDFDTVRLVIVQPRAGGVKEWVTSVTDLYAWARAEGAAAVIRVSLAQLNAGNRGNEASNWEEVFLSPGEAQCKFCPAKATCPALRDSVANALNPNHSAASPDEFIEALSSTCPAGAADEPAWLAACLSKVDLIEDWCKAVRAEAERRLLAGEEVPGFKVVQGKKGNRKWVDPAAVEDMFKKTYRLKIDEMYDLSLVSPTTIDKRMKPWVDADGVTRDPVLGPRQWAKVTGLITQSEGKPHVAPASDPRPALAVRPVRDDFTDLAGDIA